MILQWCKTSSNHLKSRLFRQIEQAQLSRGLLKNRLGVSAGLSEFEQATYYSSWVFGAVHAAASLPEYNNAEQISQKLGIALKPCVDALDFLMASGILNQDTSGKLSIGKKQIHIGAESSMITRHHINWRLRAMQAIETDPKSGLHYSSIISLSRTDFQKLREVLINTLSEMKPIIRDSKEEEVASLSIDFFKL